MLYDRNALSTKTQFIFEEIADKNGSKTYSITRWMRRFDKGNGGVTIMVDKQLRSRDKEE